MNLATPTISTFLNRPDGTRFHVQAWTSNENDYNVAMMRLDVGSTLYGITDDELHALRTQ